MELDLALQILHRLEVEHSRRPIELAVRVYQPGTLGGTPCVKVIGMTQGIDWDQGTLLIATEQPLTVLTPEDVEAIRKSAAQGQSWHAYQSYKTQNDRIKALEAEVASLKAELGR